MLLYDPSIGRDAMFQSAPDREAGRCDVSALHCLAHHLFQSAPDREAGRCTYRRCIASLIICFNPRPTVRPGDACRG